MRSVRPPTMAQRSTSGPAARIVRTPGPPRAASQVADTAQAIAYRGGYMSTLARSSSVLLVATSLLAVACGGKSHPAAAPPAGGGGGGDAPAVGTSGAPGLDWGATSDAVLAVQPRATTDDAGLVYLGTVEKRQAIVHYVIPAAGLQEINIEFTDGFATMEACGEDWKALRATLDGRLGPSQSDNLAAYWNTPTAAITLACNPNDSGAGVLSLGYAPPAGE